LHSCNGLGCVQNATCNFVQSIAADKIPQMMTQFTSQPAVTHLTPNEDTIFSNIAISLIFLDVTARNTALWRWVLFLS
jgi:hypothetical protein